MGEKSYRLEVRMLNNNTGEVLSTSVRPVTIFANGDGEKRVTDWINSLFRGLRSTNDGLSLEFNFYPVISIKEPLIF